ncbi:MAG: phenylalanine--tRNA ligase subunit beta [Candidatus Omnitrophica bacterium CG11_big_fil_rev_8_21_14_0_20_42_13]|uniref:Phenylalanine--tRNA ligase beta subunit n=1 Tax=Candidatus Ghiorseimicrobium undicola TaxID=1974746 RepID=A0A2H0LZT4_9BACT|nr:MAG: phenylalanine--tRNA ligase subunit beta [Candidatus Omnitrophica bacterium CG11_big_fil_rev_8_21_14_0_20_42_13]
MKATYNWLKDYVDIKMPPVRLAEALTMAGLEVTHLEKAGNDWVFDIEITSNRPDWLSIIGLAREVAAITKSKIKNRKSAIQATAGNFKKTKCPQKIEIQNKKDCPLYTATIIKGVKVSPSPGWMRDRLCAIGLRPVNNIVDITNYMLYETGQPLHAFDLGKLLMPESGIVVRKAKQGEEIITIDGIKRTLNENILVIANNNRPIAVAGIIGGKESEVDGATVDILLEAAEFDPVIVRKGARLLGVSSDSSYRFERGIDYSDVLAVSQRAAGLILKLAGGRIENIACQPVKLPARQRKKIILSRQEVQKKLGVKISAGELRRILSSLSFKLKTHPVKLRHGAGSSQSTTVIVPSFRKDVAICEDLLEEIGRIYGYAKIPATLPHVLTRVINPKELAHLKEHNPGKDLINTIREALIVSGYYEVINYSLIPKDAFIKNQTKGSISAIEVENALSREQEVLRTDLFYGLLNNTAHNLNRRNKDVKIFELGKIFQSAGNQCREELALGLACCGNPGLDWQRPQTRLLTLFDLKGELEHILSKLGIENATFSSGSFPLFTEGASFSVKIGSENIGVIGEVKPEILGTYSIRENGIFMAQLGVNILDSNSGLEKSFKQYSVYPSVARDISLLLKDQIQYRDILAIINSSGSGIISGVKLLEQYTGRQIPEGFKNLLISLEYNLSERTLTDNEVDGVHSLILKKLTEDLGATIR